MRLCRKGLHDKSAPGGTTTTGSCRLCTRIANLSAVARYRHTEKGALTARAKADRRTLLRTFDPEAAALWSEQGARYYRASRERRLAWQAQYDRAVRDDAQAKLPNLGREAALRIVRQMKGQHRAARGLANGMLDKALRNPTSKNERRIRAALLER